MRKIKIIRILNDYYNDDSDYSNEDQFVVGVSEWNQVTDEQYKFIKDHLYLMNYHTGYTYKIIEQVDNVIGFIYDIEKTLKTIKIEKEKKEAARAQKSLVAKEKRLAQKADRDRKALEKLIKEIPELIKEAIINEN